MGNSQPLMAPSASSPGAAMDLCGPLDRAISAIGAGQVAMEEIATSASGGVLLIGSAKSALTAARKDAQRAITRLAKIMTLCHAVRDLEADPDDSLAATLHANLNDGADDAPDPFAAISGPPTIVLPESGEHPTQPVSDSAEEVENREATS